MIRKINGYWKRLLTGLLTVVMATGILPVSSYAASGSSAVYAPTETLS